MYFLVHNFANEGIKINKIIVALFFTCSLVHMHFSHGNIPGLVVNFGHPPELNINS